MNNILENSLWPSGRLAKAKTIFPMGAIRILIDFSLWVQKNDLHPRFCHQNIGSEVFICRIIPEFNLKLNGIIEVV